MVTDSISEEGAVAYLQDMYLRKKGELISRGPVYANQRATIETESKFTTGFSGGSFHPNFGTSAVRGLHTSWDVDKDIRDSEAFQLIGVGLQSVLTNDTPQEGLSMAWQTITEGTNHAQVYHDVAGTLRNLEACYQSVNTGSETVYFGETGYVYKWGGSFATTYATGTVSLVSGIVVGSGTSWLANCEAGQYILIDGVGENGTSGEQRAFLITAVLADTQIQIEYSGLPDSGPHNYRIQSVAALNSPAGVWNGDTEKPFTVGVGCYHQGHLVLAGVSDADSGFNSVFDFDKVMVSGTLDNKGSGTSAGFSHMDLWHTAAAFRVMPGVGGFIRGMASMGNNLVIVKSHGLFKVNLGTLAYTSSGDVQGLPSLSVVSSTVGALGFRAWAETPVGLVLANETGLWIYDPDEGLQNLCDGRIDNLWESFVHYARDLTVNVIGSLVVVGSSAYPDLPCIVWDMEKNYFWVGSNMSFSKTLTLYASDDQWLGHIGLGGHVLNLPKYEIDDVKEARVKEIPTSYLSAILHWNTDPAGTDMDASGINVGPDPIVATLPIPLSPEEGGPGDGRVNNIGVTIYNDKRMIIVARPGDSGVDQILYSEHQSDGVDFGVNAGISRLESTLWGEFVWGEATWGSSVVAGGSSHGGFVEMEIPLSSEVGDYSGGYKNVRVPVDSFPSAPFVSLVFKSSENYALDYTSYQVRLQAIYIDYETTSNFGTM